MSDVSVWRVDFSDKGTNSNVIREYRMVANFCGYNFLGNRPKFGLQKFSLF